VLCARQNIIASLVSAQLDRFKEDFVNLFCTADTSNSRGESSD